MPPTSTPTDESLDVAAMVFPAPASEAPIEVADSKFGAAIYEPFLWLGERLGMADRRARLLTRARGRVLEIGAGTGLNLRHYPPTGIEELVLAEPATAMAAKIDLTRCGTASGSVSIVNAPAERLPFADDSFDTVVSTMVLCTVTDPEQTLTEISRVLRPGGKLLFCEHVESDSRALAAFQRRLARPWAAFAEGCRCDRRTVATIARLMRLGATERDSWRGMAPLVRPLVIGSAEPR